MSAEEVTRLIAGDPHAVQDVLTRVQGSQQAYLANALLLRAQKRAVYLPHNQGHYALGAKAYCHFTSPIRRYPDVLVHRALKELLGVVPRTKATAQTEEALPQLCRTCSERERTADAASRDTHKIKMAELFAEKVGEVFSGIVTGSTRYGLFVMLDETCAEGMLSLRGLDDERRLMSIGKRVAVRVTDVDVTRGHIDLALA